MSIDTFMMMRTTVPVKAIAERLIEDYGLVDDGDGCLGGNPTTVIVESWNREDHGNLIEGGFEAATIFIKFIPESSAAGFARQDHILASILRNTPGDACTQIQTGIVLGLLRVGSVVYVNPDSIGPEDLTENGYVPEKLVIGIPPDLEQVQRSPIR